MNRRLQAKYLTNRAFALVTQGLQAESQGKFGAARQRFEAALRPLEMAVEADPSYEHAHNECAFVLARLQRPDEAANSARKAISLASGIPKFHMTLIGIGLDEVRGEKTCRGRKRAAKAFWNSIREMTRKFPHYPSGFLARAQFLAMTGKGQSLWEKSLSRAARAYFGMKRMSSGEPATEAAIAQAIKINIIKCLELASEWNRLPD